MSRSRLLSAVAVGYVVLDLLHFGDHVRQGRVLAPQVYAVGNVGLVAAVVVAVLALRRRPLAAPAAAVFGVAAAIGVTATHLLPAWGYFSDSYIPLHRDALSWLSACSLVVAGLALGACGMSLIVTRESVRRPSW